MWKVVYLVTEQKGPAHIPLMVIVNARKKEVQAYCDKNGYQYQTMPVMRLQGTRLVGNV